ncbi:Peptidase dimerisation domain-containing protein [Anaerovirgula multivorans]|uniref:Peptidase dimerisation domain-containing protein n=2 Tax=Anaerovirgula multivorans TaxID=312168 RepID=A0A239FZS4_9FIRM|nr:Peptidase dimerisation domain-containing protein [Anaerovirgula multivorans]
MINAVPDYAEIKVDIRFVSDDVVEDIKEDLVKIVSSNTIEEAKSELIIDNIFSAFSNEYNKKFYEFVKSISIKNELGEPEGFLLGGASDAAYISKAGVPCLCGMGVKGVKGEWNHTNREYAIIDSALERIILIVSSILELENKEL